MSVDAQFKIQRRRTIGQALTMALRQRIVSSGYFDHQLGRWVQSMTLNQAAQNIDLRHRLITASDQHIEKKTLDDYYSYIRLCKDPKNGFDLTQNKNQDVAMLRKHFRS